MIVTWLFMRLKVGLTFGFNVEMWWAASQIEWLFFMGKAKNKIVLTLGSDFCAQSWYQCSILPASTKNHSSTSWGLHLFDQWESNLRNWISSDKSKISLCSRCLRHVQSRTPSCFPVTDARDIFPSKCPLHRPQAVGILIFGGPPPCRPGCQPDSALIEDTGAEKALRYYSQGVFNSHTLLHFYTAESDYSTP